MNKLKSICVFCGSSQGKNYKYTEAARQTAKMLAEKEIRLIYGGGMVGLMGIIADEVLKYGGKVTGVIPRALNRREVTHTGLTEIIIVDTMHQRKQKMSDLADGFIAMPGGVGTLEEYFEIMTWTLLGIHSKPCGLLNVDNFYDELILHFEKMTAEGFIWEPHKDIFLKDTEPEPLLEKMQNYKAPELKKWMDKEES